MFRRLVARTFAQRHAEEIASACSPYQYALSTRAGTECVAPALQASTALDPGLTILSVDGIGAFDNISRAAMLEGLRVLPGASEALPFVRCFYGRQSHYLWTDDNGVANDILQSEREEQGDPLMSLLYALGQHPSLLAMQEHMQEGEKLYAFLDDVYITCQPHRVRILYDALQQCLWNHSRIRINLGKTKIWNRGGIRPANCEDMVDSNNVPAWRGDHALPTDVQGIKILGTPIGHSDFVTSTMNEVSSEHARFLERIPEMPDLQAAWLLLSHCAASRANYYLRALPLSGSLRFANRHDGDLRACLSRMLDVDIEADSYQGEVMQLPLRLGGLGLRSALRTRAASSWASWADGISMIRERNPSTARDIMQTLNSGQGDIPQVLGDLNECRDTLHNEGFTLLPTWEEIANGVRPPASDPNATEPGEWAHGWQYHAASARETFHREASVMATASFAQRALLRSQSGPASGAHLSSIPTSDLIAFSSQCFKVLLLRRLRLRVPASSRHCRCGGQLDPLGDHRTACPRAGVLGPRGFALEAAAARISREAGARVVNNCFLRDLNLDVPPEDGRRLEVVANNLPLWNGAQLAIDTTLVSPLRGNGTHMPNTHAFDGLAARRARRRKENTYPELLRQNGRVRLVVLALETGGRWSQESIDFITKLAQARARSAPLAMCSSVAGGWNRRWINLFACASQRSVALSLLELPAGQGHCLDGHAPFLGDILADDCRSDGPSVSRLQ